MEAQGRMLRGRESSLAPTSYHNLHILTRLVKPPGKGMFPASSLTSPYLPSQNPTKSCSMQASYKFSNTCGMVKFCPIPRVGWTFLENVTQDASETLHVVIGWKHGNSLVCSVGLIWPDQILEEVSFLTEYHSCVRFFVHHCASFTDSNFHMFTVLK